MVSDGEFDEVLKAPDNLRDKAILHLLYSTGIRTGELCTIKTEDVDLDSQTIRILDSKKYRYFSIPISVKCCELLAEYIDGNDGWLFPSQKGGHIKVRWVELIVKKYSRFKPRDFRRRLARLWVIKKGSLTDLQKILRHKWISTTSIYVDGIRFAFEEEQFQQEYSRIMG